MLTIDYPHILLQMKNMSNDYKVGSKNHKQVIDFVINDLTSKNILLVLNISLPTNM